jgi:hypothetical protein
MGTKKFKNKWDKKWSSSTGCCRCRRDKLKQHTLNTLKKMGMKFQSLKSAAATTVKTKFSFLIDDVKL